jgi:F-type H+-transporting ATPase subunit b
MEQLLHAFGIDVKLITIQIINFVVLAGLLSYFLYKPVLKILQDREDTIKKGIADAEAAALAKASAVDEKRTVLEQAQTEAQAIESRATAYAKQKEEDILKHAKDSAEVVLTDAHAKSEQLKAQAIKESEAEIAKLAILATEKMLREKNS